MKTHMQRWLARVALSLVAIAAWGTGATAQSLSGVYGGENCPYVLTFRGKDVVYIQFLVGGKAMAELPGQYKVDGDKIAVTAPSWGAVFTRRGDTLETPTVLGGTADVLGGTAVCTKVSDIGSARPGGSGRVSAGSGPGSAFLAYYDALKRGDAISAARFVPSSDSAKAMREIPDMIREMRSHPPKAVKILHEDVTGDRAEVTLEGTVVQGSGRGAVDTAIFALIHTDGRWTFDPTAHLKLPHKDKSYVAKDKDYVAQMQMRSDLRNLQIYEEQYAADNNGAYFSGTATMASPLKGLTPSQNVTITATIVAGPRKSWSATATHSLSAKVCDNSTGVISLTGIRTIRCFVPTELRR
jgi:hypothetical protein